MPNWVYNSINIYGEKDKVQGVLDLLAKPYKDVDNGEVNFLNLIAPPDEHWDDYNCGNVSMEDHKTNPWNWYDWNINNWDTKWNACGDGGGVTVEEHDDGSVNASIYFETAWSPPRKVIEALVEVIAAEGLGMDYRWEEEQGFGAEFEWHQSKSGKGDIVCIREWDIPCSHKDMMALDRTCVCEYEEQEDYWFEDCPRTVVGSDNNESN